MNDQPPFVFEGQPDRATITAAVRHVSRRRMWIFYALGLVIALAGLVNLLTEGGMAAGITFIVLGAVWIVVMPAIALRKAVKRGMKQVSHPTTYRIDENGVTQNNMMATSTFRWPMITAIEELPGQVLVRVGKLQFVPLPTATVPEPTRLAMVAFLRAQVALQPQTL
jgi:hypothetical protein